MIGKFRPSVVVYQMYTKFETKVNNNENDKVYYFSKFPTIILTY